ncbi:hypothetical protein [Streptomyces sp. NPDC013455]|uniref:hypothetical protein n=1 Tax=Streptomyces sp. NPDC013455 TaxID=3155605 RepID=UPI00340FA4D6
MACATEEDRLGHVMVHEGPPPTVGLYLAAESLERAERTAYGVVRRALDRLPEFAGTSAVCCGTPLLVPYYERLLSTALPGGGLLMTPPDQDSAER